MLIIPLSSILAAGHGYRELPNLDGDLTFGIVNDVITNLPEYSQEALIEIDRHYDGFQRVLLKKQVQKMRHDFGERFRSERDYAASFIAYHMVHLQAARDAAWDVAAWNTAWRAVRDAAWGVARNAARDAVTYAVRDALREMRLILDMDREIQGIEHLDPLIKLHWTLSDGAAQLHNLAFATARAHGRDGRRITGSKAIIAKHTWENPEFLGDVDGMPGSITNPFIGAMKEIFGKMYIYPHTLVRSRALCLSGRARPTVMDGVPAAYREHVQWLCTSSPLWVVMRVCELLTEPSEIGDVDAI
jgi:hypothetical protein